MELDDDEDTEWPEVSTDKNEILLRNITVVAKPSPKNFRVNVGTVIEVPFMMGNVFPYFHGLNSPDAGLAFDVLGDYFFGSFGTSRDESIRAFQRFKSNWGNVYRSPAGLAVTHMLLGCKLALSTQTRLFILIEEGRYDGFVLLGAQYKIMGHKDRVYEADSAERVRRELNDMTTHYRSLREIASALSDVEVSGADISRVSVESIRNPRVLHDEFHRRRENMVPSVVEEIVKLMKSCTFPERYVSPHAGSITESLEMIYGDREILLSEPMFLTSDNITDNSTLFRVLSRFGPTAPSFITAGGERYSIPKGLDAEDPLSTIVRTGKGGKQTEVRALATIHISMKKLSVAIEDFVSMSKSKQISFFPNERAGSSRQIVLRKEHRDTVWRALRQFVGANKSLGELEETDTAEGLGGEKVLPSGEDTVDLAELLGDSF